MPSEERYINFNLEEVQSAISIGCAKEQRDPLPSGKLISIEIDEENEASNDIYFHIKNRNGEDERLSFDRKFFALSLVFYCQGSGIPIPAKGQKFLNVQKDHIIMSITMDRKALDV